jgi:hypothetical protein
MDRQISARIERICRKLSHYRMNVDELGIPSNPEARMLNEASAAGNENCHSNHIFTYYYQLLIRSIQCASITLSGSSGIARAKSRQDRRACA